MHDELIKLLGEYKVIGDTTYGLGFKEADELVDKIITATMFFVGTIPSKTVSKLAVNELIPHEQIEPFHVLAITIENALLDGLQTSKGKPNARKRTGKQSQAASNRRALKRT